MITTEQRKWTEPTGWSSPLRNQLSSPPQLVLAFGATGVVKNADRFHELRTMYPKAIIVTCSTAGEILDNQVYDDSLVATAIHFSNTTLVFKEATITHPDQSAEVGAALSGQLPSNGLKHVMVFSEGLLVNGTELVRGMASKLPASISVTGGLVGDGALFKETYVGVNAPPKQNNIVVIGFYGSGLKIGYGSLGGWDTFGVDRLITKSKHNVLYELDNRPALDLYKEYLGEQAKNLPGSGLLFPLSLKMQTSQNTSVEVVRTLLAVDENKKSMTFAGDMPEGVYSKLMRANFERLIDGASTAAKLSAEPLGSSSAELAILISCVGRKLVLRERIEEEVEAVRTVVGNATAITGFYSYGEICPTAPTEKQCQLHNQTMTITIFRESS